MKDPKLFIRNERISKVENPVVKKAEGLLINVADEMLLIDPPERILIGKRLLAANRAYFKSIAYMAYAFRITGDIKYADQVEKYLKNACAFSDWNPSHFLDVATMTTALSIGLDWLGESLPEDTKNLVIENIVKKGLRPSYDEMNNYWVKRDNNWNQVCHAGMVLGAMVAKEQYPELADSIISRAKNNIHFALDTYNPDGVYLEGTSYWEYGSTNNILMYDAYQKLYSDSLLYYSEGFLKSGKFMLHSQSEVGNFNYSDSKPSISLNPALFWVAQQTGNKEILYYQLRQLDAYIKGDVKMTAEGVQDRYFPFLIIWLKEMDINDIAKPETLAWSGGGLNPVSFMRSGWEPGSLFVGFKGGSPSLNHAHMDVGSFVFDVGGIRWAHDLGMHDYNALESKGLNLWPTTQNSERWQVFRYNTSAHNTLMVDGQQQLVSANAQISNFFETDSLLSTTIDMTSAYSNNLSKAIRSISVKNGERVIIGDSIQNNNKESNVRWAMLTYDNIELLNSTTARIKKDGKSLVFKILQPKNAVLKLYSTQPTLEYEEKNEGYVMLGFDYALAPNQSEYLEIEMMETKQNIKNKKQIKRCKKG